MTAGQPVLFKALPLVLETLQLAKNEFNHTIDLGIIRPSNSSRASPLHMVIKNDSNDWCPTGDHNYDTSLHNQQSFRWYLETDSKERVLEEE